MAGISGGTRAIAVGSGYAIFFTFICSREHTSATVLIKYPGGEWSSFFGRREGALYWQRRSLRLLAWRKSKLQACWSLSSARDFCRLEVHCRDFPSRLTIF